MKRAANLWVTALLALVTLSVAFVSPLTGPVRVAERVLNIRKPLKATRLGVWRKVDDFQFPITPGELLSAVDMFARNLGERSPRNRERNNRPREQRESEREKSLVRERLNLNPPKILKELLHILQNENEPHEADSNNGESSSESNVATAPETPAISDDAKYRSDPDQLPTPIELPDWVQTVGLLLWDVGLPDKIVNGTIRHKVAIALTYLLELVQFVQHLKVKWREGNPHDSYKEIPRDPSMPAVVQLVYFHRATNKKLEFSIWMSHEVLKEAEEEILLVLQSLGFSPASESGNESLSESDDNASNACEASGEDQSGSERDNSAESDEEDVAQSVSAELPQSSESKTAGERQSQSAEDTLAALAEQMRLLTLTVGDLTASLRSAPSQQSH